MSSPSARTRNRSPSPRPASDARVVAQAATAARTIEASRAEGRSKHGRSIAKGRSTVRERAAYAKKHPDEKCVCEGERRSMHDRCPGCSLLGLGLIDSTGSPTKDRALVRGTIDAMARTKQLNSTVPTSGATRDRVIDRLTDHLMTLVLPKSTSPTGSSTKKSKKSKKSGGGRKTRRRRRRTRKRRGGGGCATSTLYT